MKIDAFFSDVARLRAVIGSPVMASSEMAVCCMSVEEEDQGYLNADIEADFLERTDDTVKTCDMLIESFQRILEDIQKYGGQTAKQKSDAEDAIEHNKELRAINEAKQRGIRPLLDEYQRKDYQYQCDRKKVEELGRQIDDRRANGNNKIPIYRFIYGNETQEYIRQYNSAAGAVRTLSDWLQDHSIEYSRNERELRELLAEADRLTWEDRHLRGEDDAVCSLFTTINHLLAELRHFRDKIDDIRTDLDMTLTHSAQQAQALIDSSTYKIAACCEEMRRNATAAACALPIDTIMEINALLAA